MKKILIYGKKPVLKGRKFVKHMQALQLKIKARNFKVLEIPNDKKRAFLIG